MLGAMNSNLNKEYFYYKIEIKVFISNIWQKYKKYSYIHNIWQLRKMYSTMNNNNLSNGSNKEPNKKKNKWKEILGKQGIKEHSFNLVVKCINENKEINADIINQILFFCNIKVNDKELDELKNFPVYTFDLSDCLDKNNSHSIYKLIGSVGSKKQIRGVYLFIHKYTKSKYVGSSTQLAIILNGYFLKKHRPIGLFIPLLYKEGLSNFILKIIPLDKCKINNSHIILEQYYLLDTSFNLNRIRVVNNPSGSVSKQLYMYNRDKSILYFGSNQQVGFIRHLNIHYSTLIKHLNKGTYYLGKYSFTRELNLTTKKTEMSMLELGLMLEEDRKMYNKNKPLNSLSRRVILEDPNNEKKDLLFFSLSQCVIDLKKKGHKADIRMLQKCIKLNIPYFGYFCKYL